MYDVLDLWTLLHDLHGNGMVITDEEALRETLKKQGVSRYVNETPCSEPAEWDEMPDLDGHPFGR